MNFNLISTSVAIPNDTLRASRRCPGFAREGGGDSAAKAFQSQRPSKSRERLKE